MPKFMITFGQNHPLKDYWVEVEAPDELSAREEVFSIFGNKWAFIYTAEHFNPEFFPRGKAGKTIIG